MTSLPSAEERLTTLAVGWAATGDKWAVFAECYGVMTRRVNESVAADVFHDARWVRRLLDRFADYYFDAVDGRRQVVADGLHPGPPHGAHRRVGVR